MKLAVLTRGGAEVASTRVRVLQFLPRLHERGVETRLLRPPRGSQRSRKVWYVARAIRLATWADVVLVQKPFQPPWFTDLIARRVSHLVVDVDDAIWLPPAAAAHDPRARERCEQRVRRVLQRSTRVIAGSHHLATLLGQRFGLTDVVVIPPTVDTSVITPKKREPRQPALVGWIGLPVNLHDLDPLATVFAKLVAENVIGVKVISSTPPRMPGVPDAVFEPWSLSHEAQSLQSLDIGVMPLTDDEGHRARCGLKAIQYSAAGLPVVASPVGCASEIVQHQRTGLLADTPEQWEASLRQLAGDPELRQRLGRHGRRRVEERFSISRNGDKLVDALGAG